MLRACRLASAPVRGGVVARRLAGLSATKAWLNPESLLATPDVQASDDEWLGRVGEMQRTVHKESAKMASEQAAAKAKTTVLERKVDENAKALAEILALLRGGGDVVRPFVV